MCVWTGFVWFGILRNLWGSANVSPSTCIVLVIYASLSRDAYGTKYRHWHNKALYNARYLGEVLNKINY